MRVRVCLPLLLFALAPIPAGADLMAATSGATLNRASAASAPVAVSFMSDALGSGACTPAALQGGQRAVLSQSGDLTSGPRPPPAALGPGSCTPAAIQGCQRAVLSQSVELTLGHRPPLADRFQTGPDRL